VNELVISSDRIVFPGQSAEEVVNDLEEELQKNKYNLTGDFLSVIMNPLIILN